MSTHLDQRRAGVLLHITSLPGKGGCGDMGREAFNFVNFLHDVGVTVWQTLPLGMTHGDEKTRKDLDRVFAAEFHDFASALHREVHMGHLHHEKSVDHYGVTTRSMPSAARTDKWHRETGFVGARKVFQLFEWEADRGVSSVHYV